MEEKKDCIFCKIARKEIKAEIIEESDNFLAFPDAKPLAAGHTLIIPKKHFVNLVDIPSVLGNELLDIIKKVIEKKIKSGSDGFNVFTNVGEAAGQIVKHLHYHIVPRKKSDNLKIKWSN